VHDRAFHEDQSREHHHPERPHGPNQKQKQHHDPAAANAIFCIQNSHLCCAQPTAPIILEEKIGWVAPVEAFTLHWGELVDTYKQQRDAHTDRRGNSIKEPTQIRQACQRRK